MSGVFICPSCGKRYVAKPQLVGRQVTCKLCNEKFVAQEESELLDVVEPPPMAAPVAPPPAPAVALSAFPRPASARKPSRELTDGQRFWLKWGYWMIGMGVLAMVLPLVGLQFKFIIKAGMNPVSGGLCLIVPSGVVCGLALMGRWVKYLGYIVLGLIALAVFSCLLFNWAMRPARPAWPARVEAPLGTFAQCSTNPAA